MKVVGLISGGKDSCYNMMQCVAAGHSITALAHLKPHTGDEQDSMMYQSVGHEGISLYAEAMGLPLYTGTTHGRTKQSSLSYQEEDGDEVEDLFVLLNRVKEECGVEGVSAGAVLSDYQRIRIEHVCHRLGLVSLAYLWQREQTSLLQDMISDNVHSILIKVASIGLELDHLGKTIQEMYPVLVKLHHKYGVSVCGEGGEYESFTLDCPLFHKQIIVEETVRVLHSDDAFAPVAYLKLKRLSLQDKLSVLPWQPTSPKIITLPLQIIRSSTVRPLQSVKSGKWAWLAMDGGPIHTSAEEQCQHMMRILTKSLYELSMNWKHVVFVYLYLGNMEDYKNINKEYCPTIETTPPARVCISVSLPEGVKVRLELLATQDLRDANHMHVQSLSHWAPANIGPYSQAYNVNEVVFLAGEIGLVPYSMELAEPLLQLPLSLKHTTSLLEANKTSWEFALCGMCFCVSQEVVMKARLTWKEHLLQLGLGNGCPVAFLTISQLPKGAEVEWHFIASRRPRNIHYCSKTIIVSSCYLIYLHAAYTVNTISLPHWAKEEKIADSCEDEEETPIACYMVSAGPLSHCTMANRDPYILLKIALTHLSTSSTLQLLRIFLPVISLTAPLKISRIEHLVFEFFHSTIPLSIVPVEGTLDETCPLIIQLYCI